MANYDLPGDKPWNDLDLHRKAELFNGASDEELERWASDPDCNQKHLCAMFLSKRPPGQASTLARLEANPFDPRTEVTADARYIAERIVKHLWIIFVVLPFLVAVLYEILKNV